MTTDLTGTDHAQEQSALVAGGHVRVQHAGAGAPVFVVHHDIGSAGWLPFYEQLARSAHVYVPDLPGYGQSDRPEWARFVRDEAVLALQLLDALDLDRVALVGLGFGGYIAAEMATMAQSRLSRLVLVGAMGLQPPQGEGEILDQFLLSHEEYVREACADQASFARHFGEPSVEQLVEWDINREMTTRIGWKPYMFSQQLPALLTSVRTPTLLVWGEHDRVVPRSCAERYLELLPNARLEVVPGAGHLVDVEQPERLAALVTQHLAG
jgi:pimeloyl-ACP methyl ester carboxylesterase